MAKDLSAKAKDLTAKAKAKNCQKCPQASLRPRTYSPGLHRWKANITFVINADEAAAYVFLSS